MDGFNQDKSEIFSLEVDDTTRSTMLEMTRWTKFLSVLGFIGLGLIVAAGFLFAMTLNNLSRFSPSVSPLAGLGGAGLIALYTLIAGIYFYPTYALYKYSAGMKYALNHNDKARFNDSLNYLKNMFKYIGILMILVLCIYGLVIIIGIVIAASRI